MAKPNEELMWFGQAEDSCPQLERKRLSRSNLWFQINQKHGTESPLFSVAENGVYPHLQFFTRGASRQLELNSLDMSGAQRGRNWVYIFRPVMATAESVCSVFLMAAACIGLSKMRGPWLRCIAKKIGGLCDVPVSFPFGVVHMEWSKLEAEFSFQERCR